MLAGFARLLGIPYEEAPRVNNLAPDDGTNGPAPPDFFDVRPTTSRRVFISKNNKRLAKFEIDPLKIPDKFCCALSEEIMDDPVAVNPRKIKDPRIMERANAEAERMRNLEPQPQLRLEIECYVMKQRILHLHNQKLIKDSTITYLNNVERMVQTKMTIEDVPGEFISNYLDKTIMTYPVLIDGKYIIDFCELNAWWYKHNNFLAHPCIPGVEITTLRFLKNLYRKIESFFMNWECRPLDEAVMSAIRENVRKFSEGSVHERLIEKSFPMEKLPDQLVQTNPSGTIPTHPIRIDKDYLIDYQELLNWWYQAYTNQSKNPYTGKRIKFIEYDVNFKMASEAFVKLFVESGIIQTKFAFVPQKCRLASITREAAHLFLFSEPSPTTSLLTPEKTGMSEKTPFERKA